MNFGKSKDKMRKKQQPQVYLVKDRVENQGLRKKEKPELHFHQYLKTDIDSSNKMKFECKKLQKQMLYIKKELQLQLDSLLQKERSDKVWQCHQKLLSLQLFRYKQVSAEQLLEEYGKLIQATELLYSKLHNNERVKECIFLSNQEDFILFFKHLFGKPYTLCNLPHFRRILGTIWDKNHLPNMKKESMLEDLKIWAHGIHLPLNPISIYLQRKVFGNHQILKKDALLLNNSVCFCHIQAADCLGLTPLLLAAHCNKTSFYEQAVKCSANIFQCPLTVIKGFYKFQKSIKKKESLVTIDQQFPIPQRHQYNPIQILIQQKQFQQIINLLSLEQTRQIKELKKCKKSLYEKISKMPNCCFQLHWKTFNKSFLSFKAFPKDIVTIFKKDGCIRIDYHIDDFQKPTQEGNYTILLKTFQNQEKKIQFYFINHKQKKVYNLMKEVDSSKLKLRYEQITGFGNIQSQTIIHSKSVLKKIESAKSKGLRVTLDMSLNFYYENVIKAEVYNFSKVEEYEKKLYQSDVIDYKVIQTSQIGELLNQKIGSLPKVKSKQYRTLNNLKIEWVEEKINLLDFYYVLTILNKKSVFFVKIGKIFQLLIRNKEFEGFNFKNKLPYSITMDIQSSFGLTIDIKNILYCALDDAVFSLEYRTKTQEYEENLQQQSLQQTMLMNESYSIDISRFLGKTQRLLEKEDETVCNNFEEMLKNQIQQFEYQQNERGNIILSNFLSQIN